MEYIQVSERPTLREPVLIAAFAGWNDAAEVATSAARLVIRQLAGRRIASLDPEEFYVFTETRPQVRIVGASQRRIDWPANDFFCVQSATGERDLVIVVGVEPQLRWKTFSRTVLGHARELGVSLLVTLGGLLADVPHTVPPRLSGSATSPELQRRLRGLRVGGSRYEGPTGILGVLGVAARELGLPSASIWGNVPHYISSSQNPRVSLAMLRQLTRLLDLELDLAELASQADSFDEQVREIVARNPEVSEYVRQLEQREGRGERPSEQSSERPGEREEGQRPTSPPSELPSSDVLIRDVEDFLKRRPDGGPSGEG